MKKQWIKNIKELAVTEQRREALDIVIAGYDAIDTQGVIKRNVTVRDGVLSILDKQFNLNNFRKIYLFAIGKASCSSVIMLENILQDKIAGGVVIDKTLKACRYVEAFEGTHPQPSVENVEATRRIIELSKNITEDDLVIVVVSGGGSAMLCWPESECEQSIKLYDASLSTDWTIHELNTVRKHISELKGGGLAKLFYPAEVVGLIFCDVPGDRFCDVASGPTYKDESTIEDAENILKEYGLENDFELFETVKDDKYFKKVINIPLVSSNNALKAMSDTAQEFGYKAKIISRELCDFADKTLDKIFSQSNSMSAVLGAGEIRMRLPKTLGRRIGNGGRNLHLTLKALDRIKANQIFISFASDGIDNSDAAGAIADLYTLEKCDKLKLDREYFKETYKSYEFFEKTGDLIFTGATGANVADLQLLLVK